MKIRAFGVETWMNAYETRCRYNLAETCVASVTLAELTHLSGRNDDLFADLMDRPMTYGAIEGSDRLRDAISTLYETRGRDDILTTHGTIGANALAYKALVDAGDHVVAILPSYQQHDSIPESIGAEMSRLFLREEDGFLPNLEALSALIRPDTKLVSFTNPNNPTGAALDAKGLSVLVDLICPTGAYLLCDEVYRGTEQPGIDPIPAITDLYEKGISTASMSKAFSLAGLRLGWMAGPADVISAVVTHRDYDTISMGQIDEHLAAIALESKDALLARSKEITRTNLATLDAWLPGIPQLSYVKPTAATICLLKYDLDIPSHALCLDILEKTGVLLTPGSAFDMEGYLRIGFGNSISAFATGLEKLTGYFRELSKKEFSSENS